MQARTAAVLLLSVTPPAVPADGPADEVVLRGGSAP